MLSKEVHSAAIKAQKGLEKGIQAAMPPMRKAPPGQMPRFGRKRTQAEPRQALNAAMVDALYAAIEPEYRLLFLLMVDHGLRREEAMHLRFEDIDLQHKVISVLGKGNKRRIVPFMSERFEQELTTAMQRQGRKRGPVAVNPETSRPYYDIRKALLRAAIACGDKAAVKAVNKAYHAHKGVRL